MNIRSAVVTDAHQIIGFWNPQIRDGAVTFNSILKTETQLIDEIENRQAEGKGFLVAEQEAEVLGFATYSQFRGGPGYAATMEHTVMIKPAAQDRGIGSALMSALEEHARALNVHSMIAGVSSENLAAVAFHSKIGYQKIAELPEVGYKHDRWMGLILLQKFL